MRPLLDLFNKFEHPDVEDHVSVIVGTKGEIFVTVRPVEAWERFAEVAGFASIDDFYDETDFGGTMVWSEDQRRGEYNGCVIQTVELEGYYRDGKDHL